MNIISIPNDVLRVNGLAHVWPFRDLMQRVQDRRYDLAVAAPNAQEAMSTNLNRVELDPEAWMQIRRDEEFLKHAKYTVNPTWPPLDLLSQILGVPVFVRL